MRPRHFIVALLLAGAVMLAFASPLAQLPESALRAQQGAVLVFLSIALAARCMYGMVTVSAATERTADLRDQGSSISSPALFLLTCALRC